MSYPSTSQKTYGLLGAIVGGLLIGLPVTSQAAPAASSQVNPCPKIFYQEPYDDTVRVPQGCTPNSLTQSLGGQQSPLLPPVSSQINTPRQQPLPEERSQTTSRVMPVGSTVNEGLKNDIIAVAASNPPAEVPSPSLYVLDPSSSIPATSLR